MESLDLGRIKLSETSLSYSPSPGPPHFLLRSDEMGGSLGSTGPFSALSELQSPGAWKTQRPLKSGAFRFLSR